MLSAAVQVALDLTNSEEILGIVTTDHGHTVTILGYSRRGNPILGKVVSVGKSTFVNDSENLLYATSGFQNGPGF